MSELARRRRARDLWISRGHVWAALAAAALIGLAGFIGGWWMAGSRTASPAAPVVTTADEALVDLLARVDRRVVAHDGAETLTFPDALMGIGGPATVPEPAAEDPVITTVAAGAGASRPVELIVRAASQAAQPALIAALVAGGWEPQARGDELVLLAAPDRATGAAERDRLARFLSERELTPQIELRAAPLAEAEAP